MAAGVRAQQDASCKGSGKFSANCWVQHVEWLLELGLSKMQVAKAVAVKPQPLGYSVEENLKLTVEWLLELGLSKMQVAKVVASFPPILGLSVENNLQPKSALLRAYFTIQILPRPFPLSWANV